MVERRELYEIAQYFIENKSTVRKTAKHFGYNKTAMHEVLTKDLLHESPTLYESVRKILDRNREEAPARGGYAVQASIVNLEQRKSNTLPSYWGIAKR